MSYKVRVTSGTLRRTLKKGGHLLCDKGMDIVLPGSPAAPPPEKLVELALRACGSDMFRKQNPSGTSISMMYKVSGRMGRGDLEYRFRIPPTKIFTEDHVEE